jgi:hypothetical protein
MLQLAMILMLLPQEPQAPAQEPTPPPPPVVYDQGPMTATLVAMREVRLVMVEGEPRPGMESDLRMQFRIAGDKLGEISRFGNFILTELVDDTGQSLIDENTYSPGEKELMRPNNIPPERLRESGLLLTTRTKPAARAAKTLKTIRGYCQLTLATSTQSVTVENPLQYYDRVIETPALKELGVEIRVVPLEEFDPANVRSANFVDGWMRPVRAPERTVTSKSGAECTVFTIDPGNLNNELQLVLELHPNVENLKVEYAGDNIALP